MKGRRLVLVMTLVNSLVFLWNLVGGWFLFFTYGARPDGVVPAPVHWLMVIWMTGPVWSVTSLVLALVLRAGRWQKWTNAAVTFAYALIWAFLLLH